MSNEWSRFSKVHEYCDLCVHNDKCTEWCFGDKFRQSETKIIKQTLIQKFLNWLWPKTERE